MPHQCVHCGKLYEKVSKEILEGCTCGSHFFFFIKDEQIDKLQEKNTNQIINLNEDEKTQIETDIREIIGLEEEQDTPVILDLESIKAVGPGKFEIDIVNLFSKKRPLIYKLEEGKYIIDLASTLRVDLNKKD